MATELFARAASPESAGVPSDALVSLLDRLLLHRVTMHSLLVIRHGQVAYEANWAPFNADQPHRMYSISKSFTALAIGLLIDEGKLSLEDKVYTFFPDKVPENLHPYLKDATVRDLLMMSTPHTATTYDRDDPDWVATFFQKTPSHAPGTIFHYDTSGTVVLCSIVERLAGMPYLEYLRPRLLEPIGFGPATCIKTPEGTSWGGSGVLCSLRDMARIAQVCMSHGRWGDKQLISQRFIDAATAKQIDNSLDGSAGYGYQIWRIPGNGFSFFGMGGQFAFCYPDKDLIISCVADQQCDPGRISIALVNLAHELMTRVPGDASLPPAPGDQATLAARTKDLALLPLLGETTTPMESAINGRWFAFSENPMGIRRARLVLNGAEGAFEYENERGAKRIEFGLGAYKQGTFPEAYFDEQIGVVTGRQYRTFSTAAWVEPHKLYLRACVADTYFGGLQVYFSYKGNEATLYMTKVAEWFLDDYQGFAGGKAE